MVQGLGLSAFTAKAPGSIPDQGSKISQAVQHSEKKKKRFGDLPLYLMGFPGGSDGKESACNVGDLGSIPGLGRFPGEGNDYHSSILAWRIPWTEEPGGLQFTG